MRWASVAALEFLQRSHDEEEQRMATERQHAHQCSMQDTLEVFWVFPYFSRNETPASAQI